jgi:hypothetical protein
MIVEIYPGVCPGIYILGYILGIYRERNIEIPLDARPWRLANGWWGARGM